MAAIDLSKESAAAKYVVEQQARMMEWNCKTSKLHGKSTTGKRDDVEVVLENSTDYAHTTKSERILTLELIMWHCVVLPADVNHAKSIWGGRGSSCVLT